MITYLTNLTECYFLKSCNELMKGNTNGNSKSQGETISRDNNLAVTLPQDNTDLSLDKETYNYADSTAHSKSRTSDNSTQNTNQENNSISYDVGRLGELQAFHDNLFNELDKMLFSQIF